MAKHKQKRKSKRIVHRVLYSHAEILERESKHRTHMSRIQHETKKEHFYRIILVLLALGISIFMVVKVILLLTNRFV